MTSSIISALSVLAGGLLTHLLQQRAARTEAARADRETDRGTKRAAVLDLAVALSDHRTSMYTRREEALNAPAQHPTTGIITNLAVALSDHRTAMYTRGEEALLGGNTDRSQALRDRSHETRRAIEAPLTQLQLVVDDEEILQAAQDAAQATYAMRNASNAQDLQHLRRAALDARDHLVQTARRQIRT